jgi:hypothetical protein
MEASIGTNGVQETPTNPIPTAIPSVTTPQGEIRPKKSHGCTTVFFGCLTLCGIVGVGSLLSFKYVTSRSSDSPSLPIMSPAPQDETQGIQISPVVASVPKTDMIVPSPGSSGTYDATLGYKPDVPAYIVEVYWLNFVMKKLVANGWDGKETTPLPITIADIPSTFITKLRTEEDARKAAFAIPPELQKYYFGNTSEEAITKTIGNARNEFVAFLKTQSVHKKYIDEIDTNTLPADGTRMFYHTGNGANAGTSQSQALMGTDGTKADYSKLQMDLFAIDFYNHSRKIARSGLAGPEPANGSAEFDAYYKKVQDIAIRYLVYHEMGHVLEKAVESVNARPDKKTEKSSWIWASKTLSKLDSSLSVHWSNLQTFNEINDITSSKESQAEGMSYQALVHTFAMNHTQAKILWEYLFGRLAASRDEFDSALSIFQTKYPGFDITSIDQKIYRDLITKLDPASPEAKTLYAVNKRLTSFPAYHGYFHPREPKNMDALWAYIRD